MRNFESKAVAKKIVEDRKKLPDGFLDEEARRVKIGVWVRDLLEKQISKYTLATHVGKFANPGQYCASLCREQREA